MLYFWYRWSKPGTDFIVRLVFKNKSYKYGIWMAPEASVFVMSVGKRHPHVLTESSPCPEASVTSWQAAMAVRSHLQQTLIKPRALETCDHTFLKLVLWSIWSFDLLDKCDSASGSGVGVLASLITWWGFLGATQPFPLKLDWSSVTRLQLIQPQTGTHGPTIKQVSCRKETGRSHSGFYHGNLFIYFYYAA